MLKVGLESPGFKLESFRCFVSRLLLKGSGLRLETFRWLITTPHPLTPPPPHSKKNNKNFHNKKS